MKLYVTKLLILSKFRLLLFLSCSKFSDQLCTKKLNNRIDIKAAAIPYIAEILYHSIRTFFAILDSTYSTYSAKPTMQISFCAKFFVAQLTNSKNHWTILKMLGMFSDLYIFILIFMA